MNPLNGRLTRLGLIIWTLAYILLFFVLSIWIIEAAKAHQLGVVRILDYVFVFGLPVAAAVLLNLRLRDTGWPVMLGVLVLIPPAALALWIALFFIPTFKRSGTNKSLSERLSDKWYGRA